MRARPDGVRASVSGVRSVTRREVLGLRVRAQQLDGESGTVADTAILDLGAQDTGTDGARWALARRGPPPHEAASPLECGGRTTQRRPTFPRSALTFPPAT